LHVPPLNGIALAHEYSVRAHFINELKESEAESLPDAQTVR
jgi:hypothetical protein